MPKPIVLFVRGVDSVNRLVGRFAMAIFFVMAAIMLYSTVSRAVFGVPVNWALEMTQFLLSAYYLLGGAYSLQHNSHVRMDLFYARLPQQGRAVLDAFTILFVIFFLGVLLWGAISSTQYSIQYNQRNYSAWSPVLWPVKLAMTVGIFLMLLQLIAQFFRDLAAARGRPLP
ncbi:TRAP-type mannitol/chloroaromatic compound transport system, small permease component [Devosia crocina]|uniref:TRAP transporter small permease protein n=1 Tax=Devosia crocina TaxID=429728 RepID=A0A1I7NUK3_9HYPH|nr:TRAP transporter small permease subunit [Devosia crocina]SFV38321.1 TRAP-type mannitol/chloroaromatic compound transport system, small permease component [Devosia crocina]